MRTLLHEVCHHPDYTLFALGDSFHTQGFYRRESTLFKEFVPSAAADGEPRRRGAERKKGTTENIS